MKHNAAFFWDESFLWGLMAYKALKRLGLPFGLVRAEDIRAGVLKKYRMLFVPGGWASNKSKALGEEGLEAIREFVCSGGNYLGFCGGAGLATQAKGCLGLLEIKRRPTKDRVPSFSGRIDLKVDNHPIWAGCGSEASDDLPTVNRQPSTVFHAWWPSQFIVESDDIKVLATYGEAMPDAFSSDLNVGDIEAVGNWDDLERVYGINLNPRRLYGEPAVLEGSFGKGRVLLSLIHFDTPGDEIGHKVFFNLWHYLAGENNQMNSNDDIEDSSFQTTQNPKPKTQNSELFDLCAELIKLGQRNFLWFWRNNMLLQWRRGVRGLEYNTLYIMVKELKDRCQVSGDRYQGRDKRTKTEELRRKSKELRTNNTDISHQPSANSIQAKGDYLGNVEYLLDSFIEKAKRLLILERHELQKGNHITYEKCDVPEIRKLREDLFSSSKSHSGMFKELIDRVDGMLYNLLIQ